MPLPTESLPRRVAVPPALWHHYWWHLRAGIIFWAVVGACALAYSLIMALISARYVAEMLGIGDYLLLILVVLFLFSVPAALGGLLRMPALGWLHRNARSQIELVVNSVFLFAATVLLAAGGYWFFNGDHTLGGLGFNLLVCAIISLPWLVATAWASWQLPLSTKQ